MQAEGWGSEKIRSSIPGLSGSLVSEELSGGEGVFDLPQASQSLSGACP